MARSGCSVSRSNSARRPAASTAPPPISAPTPTTCCGNSAIPPRTSPDYTPLGPFDLSHDLFGHDLEPSEGRRPIAGGERHVGGVAAAADQDPADPRVIVARVERVPMAAEIGFEPGAEIH